MVEKHQLLGNMIQTLSVCVVTEKKSYVIKNNICLKENLKNRAGSDHYLNLSKVIV